MKKSTILYFASAAALWSVMAACTREADIPENPEDHFPESELQFSVESGAPVTRGAAAEDAIARTGIIDLGQTEEGTPLRFVDRITLPGIPSDTVQTKGTPATKDNVQTLYGTFSSVAYDGTTAVTVSGESVIRFAYKAVSGKWTHVFDSYPFASHDNLYFFAWMPEKPDGTVFDPSAKTISFSYTVPADAAAQKDLLFGGKATTKAAYDANPTEAFPITFHHALAGVKFAIGNDFNGTQIKRASLKNVVKSGSVVISPETPSVVWTPGESKADYSFDVPAVTETGGVKNLNDAELSLTFWLIPQTLGADAELEVTYIIAGGAEKTVSTKVNEALGGALTLAAGELHTFTLNPNEVNVTVTDNVAEELSDVEIKNSGNVAAILRAVVVANWQDAGGNIVAPWDFVSSEFEGLPGEGWTLKSDGFYYTSEAVAPGENAPALFTRYTPPTTPPVTGAHLVMDIAVQAVNTKPDSWAD